MTTTRKLFYAALAVALVCLAVVYFVYDPSTAHFFPKCAFLQLTSYKCPGCGSQRTIHALLHADVEGAFRHNALLVVSLPFIIMLLTVRLWRERFPRLYRWCDSATICIVAGTIVTAWWILRNVFGW